jgi:hypothetical protein
MRYALVSTVAVLAACGGGGAGSVAPVGSAEQAASAFMKAAADSNLSRMAELWGTSRGPASQTRPQDFERRLVILQAYLRGDSARVVSNTAMAGDDNRRRLMIALHRGTCVKQIPALMVRTGGGWIVQDVNVSAAGNPARPCDPGAEPPGNR